MEDLSLHVLDVVENAIRAGARQVRIRVDEAPARDYLEIRITDDGPGMDGRTLRSAVDPFFTTKSNRKVGLGLALLEEAAQAAGGSLAIHSQPGKGTTVQATFQYHHIDRKPLGDMTATLQTLVTGHPEIRFRYEHRRNGRMVRLDSATLPSDPVSRWRSVAECLTPANRSNQK
jgi:DNA mismatch repair ATPase MutL